MTLNNALLLTVSLALCVHSAAFAALPTLLEKTYLHYLNTGQAQDVITDGFVQFAYGMGQQPVIATHPLELTVITLEPGEFVTNVSSGDPLRWSYALSYSGEGTQKQAHVMVKPTQTEISTDVVITTDQRLYILKMVATSSGKYVRDVRFWYPARIQQEALEQKNRNSTTVAILPKVEVAALNFKYSIKSLDNRLFPAFKPIQVFDDGQHTYIQFSHHVFKENLPAVFIQERDQHELVNTRIQLPYLILDRVFEKAVLISGTGKQQQKIILINIQRNQKEER